MTARYQLDATKDALAGRETAACLAVLDVVLAEREDRRPSPELVWTGPESRPGEVAVLIEDAFATCLASQRLGLVEAGIVGKY